MNIIFKQGDIGKAFYRSGSKYFEKILYGIFLTIIAHATFAGTYQKLWLIPSGHIPALHEDTEKDSIALLQLTKTMVLWTQEGQQGSDFVPLDLPLGKSRYEQLDLKKHKERLDELRNTYYFSEGFIINYDRIARKINQYMQQNRLVWNKGELPPFGSGTSPWCNCQDRPDDFQDYITIGNIRIREDGIVYQWSMGNGVEVSTRAVKEGGRWRISWLDGFDYDKMFDSFVIEII